MRHLACLSCFALLWAAVPASAQDTEEAPADAGGEEDAQAVFELGRRASEDGRYEAAARYFERAYELSGRAELLYNVGVSMERADRPADAIDWLERYLATGDDLARRDEVEERLRALRVLTADDGAGQDADPVADETATETSDGGAVNVGAIVVLGLGVAVAGAGGAFLGLASSAAGTVTDAARAEDVYWDAVEGDAAQADTFSVLGAIFLGVGGAAIAGGVLWWALGSSGGDDEVRVSVAPNGVRLGGRF